MLAIGIDQYEHVGKLKNCVADTKAFVDVLKDQYGFSRENISEFYNKAATRAHIVEELDRLSETLEEKDNLIIYFAGHGVYKERSQMGFLVPVGGKPNSVSSLIFNGLIRSFIRGFVAHHVFLVVDSCFSGDLLLRSRGEGDEPVERYAEKVGCKPSRWGLAAGRIEEVSDGIAGNHSPFNKTLVTFLKTHSSRQFAISELINHVCKITTYNADQTPIGGILDKAKVSHTIGGYNKYLDAHPQGEFLEVAQSRIAQLSASSRRDKDLAAWKMAKKQNSLESYAAYLRDFPEGGFALLAQKNVDRLQKKHASLKEEAHRREKLRAYIEEGQELIKETQYSDALDCIEEAMAIAKEEEKPEIKCLSQLIKHSKNQCI